MPIRSVLRSPLRSVLRPTIGEGGGAYEAEASALFARFTTPPTDTRKGQINTLIKALKTAGVWTKLDALYLMAAADSQAARQNWIADQYNLSAVSGPTFAADQGYTGDASAAYLDTGFNPATATSPKYLLNSASLAFWCRTNTIIAGYEAGNSTTTQLSARSAQANTVRGRLSDGTLSNFGSTTDARGLIAINRSASNARQAYQNGASIGTDTAVSTGVTSTNLVFLSAGSGAGFGNRQVAFGAIGGSLGATEQANLYAAINTYLTAIGAA